MEVLQSKYNHFNCNHKKLHQIKNALDESSIIATTDKNGTITYVNKMFCKISKYSAVDLLGQNHRILKSGHHPPEFFQGMWKTLSQGKIWRGDIKNKAKDGTYYWVKTTIVPFFDDGGKISEYISIRTDITERKNMETKLAKYREYFEESPDMYRVINGDGFIVDCNKQYAMKLGYSKNEVIGKSIFDHVSEKSLTAIHDSFYTWKSGNLVLDKKIWFKRKDGSVFPTLLNAIIIHDQNHRIAGSVTIIKDITEMYNKQEQLMEQQSIIKSQLDEIKKIDVLKDEFISMITHELKTPLTSILMYCEILKQNASVVVQSSFSEDVDSIYRNAERLAKQIEDLFDIQKLDMEKMQFTCEEFRVDGFIQDVFKDSVIMAKPKRIKIINSTKEKISIKSDRNRLSQVFANLIRNAIEFVPQGTGRIEIGAQNEIDDVVFYVRDNGIGIPKDEQENLFKKFYQVNTSHRRKHQGTGLGLSICKRMIERMGGRIWIESEVGSGTSIYFSIPRDRA